MSRQPVILPPSIHFFFPYPLYLPSPALPLSLSSSFTLSTFLILLSLLPFLLPLPSLTSSLPLSISPLKIHFRQVGWRQRRETQENNTVCLRCLQPPLLSTLIPLFYFHNQGEGYEMGELGEGRGIGKGRMKNKREEEGRRTFDWERGKRKAKMDK